MKKPLDTVSYSQIALYTRCPMLWYYEYVVGLPSTKHPSADWSSLLVHKPIELWWKGETFDWQELWDKYVERNEGVLDPFYNLDHAQAVFVKWVREFGFDDKEEYELISAETIYQVKEIPGFVTKPDYLLKRKTDGMLVVRDVKTSKYESELLRFDRQFVGQVLGTGAEVFQRDSILMSEVGKAGSKKFKVEVFRDEEVIPDDLKREWIIETNLTVGMMYSSLMNRVYPKHAPNACFQFPRNPCERIQLCEVGELRQEILKGMMKKKGWGER